MARKFHWRQICEAVELILLDPLFCPCIAITSIIIIIFRPLTVKMTRWDYQFYFFPKRDKPTLFYGPKNYTGWNSIRRIINNRQTRSGLRLRSQTFGPRIAGIWILRFKFTATTEFKTVPITETNSRLLLNSLLAFILFFLRISWCRFVRGPVVIRAVVCAITRRLGQLDPVPFIRSHSLNQRLKFVRQQRKCLWNLLISRRSSRAYSVSIKCD